jgi:hypothetical protein
MWWLVRMSVTLQDRRQIPTTSHHNKLAFKLSSGLFVPSLDLDMRGYRCLNNLTRNIVLLPIANARDEAEATIESIIATGSRERPKPINPHAQMNSRPVTAMKADTAVLSISRYA